MVLSLCELIPRELVRRVLSAEASAVESNVCVQEKCAHLVAGCEAFVSGARELITEWPSGSETLIREPHLSAGCFESCWFVHFNILEEFNCFSSRLLSATLLSVMAWSMRAPESSILRSFCFVWVARLLVNRLVVFLFCCMSFQSVCHSACTCASGLDGSVPNYDLWSAICKNITISA